MKRVQTISTLLLALLFLCSCKHEFYREKKVKSKIKIPEDVVLPPYQGDYVQPDLIRSVDPLHPPKLIENGIEGLALTEFAVGVDGVPRDIQVAYANDKLFAESAKRALAHWRFRPATLDGKPIPVWIKVPFAFKLDL